MVFALVCSSFVFDFELLTLICYREIVKAKHRKKKQLREFYSSLPPLPPFIGLYFNTRYKWGRRVLDFSDNKRRQFQHQKAPFCLYEHL